MNELNVKCYVCGLSLYPTLMITLSYSNLADPHLPQAKTPASQHSTVDLNLK